MPVNPVTSILTSVKSSETEIRDINAKVAHGDEGLLAEIGYKQELNRTFSTFQVFGIAYSIMGVLPSIASLTGTGYAAGAGGFLWSWFVSAVFVMSIAVSMAELASAIPTSGGLYYWTFYYSPPGHRVLISYVIGMSNSMALCAGLVSVGYGFSQEVQSAVFINNPNYVITSGKTYGIFAACTISEAILTCISSRHLAWLQTTSAVCHTGIVVLFFIALPIGTKQNLGGFNGGRYIFTDIENFSDWPIGFQFVLSMMTTVWTIGAFDSCVHMSEEAKNASFGVPIGIIGSGLITAIVGFFIVLCTNACMVPDVERVLSTPTGFPIAQIIWDSLGQNWAVAMMSLIAACQWLIGSSLCAALSRQVWAFARDNGLPFAHFVKVVNPTLKVPLRAILFASIISLLLGCLCLAGSQASSALFSLCVAGNYVAWCTPVLLKLTSGRKRFHPGKFYLGKTLSTINSVITCCWGLFIIIICMIPATRAVTRTSMNYTCLIAGSCWLLSTLYFLVYKHRHFHGPKSNLSPEEAVAITSTKEV